MTAIREKLFIVKKKLIKAVDRLKKIDRIILRSLFYKEKITSKNCFKVPIIINNRNRVTYLKQMIDRLREFGYTNIVILDNDSTYPPLLEYYKTVKAEVIFLKGNYGYKALWESDVFSRFKNKYYIYSDPDVLPSEDCPHDFVYILYKKLIKYAGKEKAGCALRIDDLPDSLKLKTEIMKWEKAHWGKQLEADVYDADVDTTFALYKPLAWGNAEECAAIRVAGKLQAKHLPWYVNADELTEEDKYYKDHASQSTHWTKK